MDLQVGAKLQGVGKHHQWQAIKTDATQKLDESNKFTVKMQGTLAPYTGDLFMSSLNTLTTPSNTRG